MNTFTASNGYRVAISDHSLRGNYIDLRVSKSGDPDSLHTKLRPCELKALREFFEAHPEPKPWHNAKPGEVWALRSEDDADEFAAVRIDGHWKAAEGGWPNEDLITAGRRIWPEEAPNE